MKLISVVTPCYNEEQNVEELFRRAAEVYDAHPQYAFEHIFIDNCSQDGTVEVLRKMAARDPRVRVIANARNFGHIRSPFHAYLQTRSDAIIPMVADLQEPPALIAEFLKRWEEGFKIVVGVRTGSVETFPMKQIRRLYYRFISGVADGDIVKDFTGFGLYDKQVVDVLRTIDDPYPYFRGLISEIGFKRAEVSYHQAARFRGVTKNNFYTLYDYAMLGLTNHSKVPLRLATMLGFSMATLSFLLGVAYLVYKLLFWDRFNIGIAPMVIGLFFFGSVQLFFLGIVGEYVGAIHTQVLRRPRVVERERINFPPRE
jgi:glycosyltransferase involved in cell wall biosynthesis